MFKNGLLFDMLFNKQMIFVQNFSWTLIWKLIIFLRHEGQGIYTFNAKKTHELLKSFFFKSINAIFIYFLIQSYYQKHYKMFLLWILGTGGRLKNNPPLFKGLIALIINIINKLLNCLKIWNCTVLSNFTFIEIISIMYFNINFTNIPFWIFYF